MTNIRSTAGHVLATGEATPYFANPWDDPNAIPIPLGSKNIFAFVSAEDRHLACNRWHSKAYPRWGLIYAIRMRYDENGRHNLLLHRAVMGVEDSRLPKVDHINGNGLDCRRSNLRLASSELNGRNRVGAMNHSASGILGVYFHAGKKKWCAELTWGGRKRYLGTFDTIEAATAARLEAEAREWGIQPRRAAAHSGG